MVNSVLLHYIGQTMATQNVTTGGGQNGIFADNFNQALMNHSAGSSTQSTANESGNLSKSTLLLRHTTEEIQQTRERKKEDDPVGSGYEIGQIVTANPVLQSTKDQALLRSEGVTRSYSIDVLNNESEKYGSSLHRPLNSDGVQTTADMIQTEAKQDDSGHLQEKNENSVEKNDPSTETKHSRVEDNQKDHQSPVKDDRREGQEIAGTDGRTAKLSRQTSSTGQAAVDFAGKGQTGVESKYGFVNNQWSAINGIQGKSARFGGGNLAQYGFSGFGLNTAEIGEGETTADFDQLMAQKMEGLMGSGMLFGREGIPSLSSALSIKAPLGESQWTEALGQRVEWLVAQKIQKATIHLNPTNLGPLEISITIEGGKTHALFVSHNPQVREAIEASLPQLEQMLADAGVTLGNADVSGDTLQESGSQSMFPSKKSAESASDMNNVSSYMTSLEHAVEKKSLFTETLKWVDTFV